MEVIGTALLSAVFEQLMEKLASRSSLNFVRETQVLNKLKKWEGMLAAIHAVLDDADEKKLENEFVGKWVSKLHDLAFDVDDLLDEFAAEAQRRREPDQKKKKKKKRSKVIRKFLPSISGFRFNSEMDSKIEQVSGRLQQLIEERNVLGLGETVAGKGKSLKKKKKKQLPPPTTSLVNEATIWGRDKDKDAVMELLRMEEGERENNGRKRFNVVSITGMGGIGKTSLAQLVYNDESLSSEFSFKAWVSLGGDFDPEAITRTILDGSPRGGEDLNFLQLKLKEKLLGKKFLIVLDDVWTHRYTDWTLLCNPLEFGAPGSRIIVTTRLQDVAKMVGTPAGDQGYALRQLEYDDCLSVFLYHALDASNFDVHPGLEEYGKAIVRKCRGLPLAAKVIGGLLRGEHNVDVWQEVLRSSLWESSVVKTNILPALMLSYDHLPSHLKLCFAYCAVFPKGYVFDEEELVLLWMAEGFLQQQPKNNSKHPKELGHEYFRVLISRSFFEQSGANTASQYVMHDMISDLARFVSSGICSNLDDSHCDESRVRHLAFAQRYYDSWLRFGILEKTKQLRTFLPVGLSQHSNSYYLSTKVVHDFVPKLKRLRVLSFARYKVKELPDTIGGLKHLRMLNLSFTDIATLPESTGKLFNLQTLLLKGCRELSTLPLSLGDLINLECLDVRGASKLSEIPIEVLNLPMLKFLPVFMVSAAENGIAISKLSKFNPLQGSFLIEGLHNVLNARYAELVGLKAKKAIGGLVFDWSGDPDDSSRDETIDFQVLESLEPHVDVLGVKIHSYGGSKLPGWMGDSSFSNLMTLSFVHCQRITSLPHLGQLASLKKLVIVECSNLVGFPTNLPSLNELCIRGCQAIILQASNVYDGNVVLPSLVTCRIERIAGLVTLDETFLQDLPTLENLEIRGCPNLECLWYGTSNPAHPISLTSLAVLDCASLVSLTGFELETLLPRSLETLKIRACHHLKKLASHFDNLTSLSVLHILDCSNLASFSSSSGGGELPGGLQELAIQGCGSLESLPVVPHGHNARLEKLTIEMPVSLKQPWIPKGEFPESLKYIEITKWTSLLLQRLQQSKLPQLTRLVMGDSPDVQSTPDLYQWNLLLSTPSAALTELHIWGCENLTSLPDQAMQTLTSLRSLYIFGCGNLELLTHGGRGLPSSLDFLLVDECPALRQPISEWRLYTLTSLHQLTIIGPNPATDMVSSLPDDDDGGGGSRLLLLPPSLTHLTVVGFKNLRSISSGGILFSGEKTCVEMN
ncbi:unnamed protein product [Linum tenue]|uniref:Disease resistance RPP13-like protein 1 n=5 Tax=Linum tenue TaxID=586396 RepID=A0AAV0RC85_9ROSI|nr:unnamed protein product [Linum tenue]